MTLAFTFLLVLFWVAFILVSISWVLASLGAMVTGFDNHEFKYVVGGFFSLVIFITFFVFLTRNDYLRDIHQYLNTRSIKQEMTNLEK